MEILSPMSLWKDYDRREFELAASEPVSFKREGYTEQRVYFNGDKAEDGIIRIYARIAFPEGKGAFPSVLIMEQAGKSIDDIDFSPYLKDGYAVMAVDYSGQGDYPRYTLYPASLSQCVFSLSPEAMFDAPEDPRKSCWYLWTKVLSRAITYLETLEKFDRTRLALIGVGTGGPQVLKAAAFEELAGAITFFSSGRTEKPISPDNENELLFKSCLSSLSYASLLKCPVLVQGCSNERGSGVDALSEIFSRAGGGALFCITERVQHAITKRQTRNTSVFLKKQLRSGEALPESPVLTASASDHKLYYGITTDKSREVMSIDLFIAHSVRNGAYRNWRKIRPELIGDSEYLARADVYLKSEPVYAFVNVAYKDDLSLSSEIVTVIPAMLGITETEVKQSRLIYDSDMGTDDWVAFSESASLDSVVMKEGPFGIEGVTGLDSSLSTFKLGDLSYKGGADSVLQMIVYSAIDQEVCFTVTSGEAYKKYVCKKRITPADNWAKLNLSPEDFKAPDGVLAGWEKVITLEISAGSAVLINSVLWV